MVMNKKLPYSVPEGYFNDLSERLCELPSRHARVPFLVAFRPYLAMAVCLAVLLVAGNWLLKETSSQQGSDDSVVEYLIDSGTTLAQIEYVMDENE